MSVDFDVRVIYGFKIDRNKMAKFIKEQEEKNPEFQLWKLIEDLCWKGPCELEYDNHYDDILHSDYICFGIPFYNKITAATLLELEKDRSEEICDEFIRVFGSYDILDNEQGFVPELHVMGVLW